MMTEPTDVPMPNPTLHAGTRLVTSAYPRSAVADYGNARAEARDAFWRGELSKLNQDAQRPQAGVEAVPDWRYMSLSAKCADLLHLLSFADIKTPTEGDALEAFKVMASIRNFINTECSVIATPTQTAAVGASSAPVAWMFASIMGSHVFYEGASRPEGAPNRAIPLYAGSAPVVEPVEPIDMVLYCPNCGTQHIDAPEEEEYEDKSGQLRMKCDWTNPPHRSHLCHACEHIWRPADVPTNGVAAVKTKGSDDSPIAHAPSSAVAASPGAVGAEHGAGWMLVPVELPDEMRLEWEFQASQTRDRRHLWKAILAVAPKPPATPLTSEPLAAAASPDVAKMVEEAKRLLVQAMLRQADGREIANFTEAKKAHDAACAAIDRLAAATQANAGKELPRLSEAAVMHAVNMAKTDAHKQGDRALWIALAEHLRIQWSAGLASSPAAVVPVGETLTDEMIVKYLDPWLIEGDPDDRADMLKCVRAMLAAPPAAPEPVLATWIDLNERLPEEGIAVLVTKDGGVEDVALDMMEEGVWREWCEYVEHVEIIGGRTSDVRVYTHWSSIPAPVPAAGEPKKA